MKRQQVRLPKCACLNSDCMHVWHPRKNKRPRQCPKCWSGRDEAALISIRGGAAATLNQRRIGRCLPLESLQEVTARPFHEVSNIVVKVDAIQGKALLESSFNGYGIRIDEDNRRSTVSIS